MTTRDPAASRNRLQRLRAFCLAAQTGSISKAAERLYLSQPSVSLLIKGLEEDLAVELFERRGPKIFLTTEGHTLLDTALPLVEGMDHLPEIFAARLGSVNAGVLDLAAGESTILHLLPPFIERFTQRYPQISLRLHNVTGHDGLARLRAGDVDVAVGSMIELPKDIVYFPLFHFDPVLIAPLGHPLVRRVRAEGTGIALADIAPWGLILPPRRLSTWRIVELVFQQHGLTYNVVLEAGGWEVIKTFVAMGLGLSIVTEICLTDDDKLERVSLAEFFPTRSYGVVMRRGKRLSPQARAFLSIFAPGVMARFGPDGLLRQDDAASWPTPQTGTPSNAALALGPTSDVSASPSGPGRDAEFP